MTNCKAPLSCDGLIFDMDGTLWDAVDSYVKIWNATIAECGIHRAPVTRDELIAQMGKPLDVILPALIPGAEGHKPGLLEILMRNEAEMMPRCAGRWSGCTDASPCSWSATAAPKGSRTS